MQRVRAGGLGRLRLHPLQPTPSGRPSSRRFAGPSPDRSGCQVMPFIKPPASAGAEISKGPYLHRIEMQLVPEYHARHRLCSPRCQLPCPGRTP